MGFYLNKKRLSVINNNIYKKMVFELILKKLSNDGFMFESLLSDVLATILAMIITAYGVIPFVSNQRKIRHYAKRIGGPACHWLYGNMHKVVKYYKYFI